MTQKTVERKIIFLKDGSGWVDHICVTPEGCAFYSPETPRKKDITGYQIIVMPALMTMDKLAALVKERLDADAELRDALRRAVRRE